MSRNARASTATKSKSRSVEPDRRSLTERHFRAAIEIALAHTPLTEGVSPIVGATAAITDFDDPSDRAALEMVSVGLSALITRNATDRAVVRFWHAFRLGGSDPDSDAVSIRNIAAAVQRAANLYPLRVEYLIDKGRAVVGHLREYLVRHFGNKVPSVDELEEWISIHAHKSANGQATTMGIVAKIVHGGRLLGAHTDDQEKVLRRVNSVLSRPSKRWAQLAG